MKTSRLFIDTIRFFIKTPGYQESVELMKGLPWNKEKFYETTINSKIISDRGRYDQSQCIMVSDYCFIRLEENGYMILETSQKRIKNYVVDLLKSVATDYIYFTQFLAFASIFGEVKQIRRVDYTVDIFSDDDLSHMAYLLDRPRSLDKVMYYKTKGCTIRIGKHLLRFYDKKIESKDKIQGNWYRFELQVVGKTADFLLRNNHDKRKKKLYFSRLWKALNIKNSARLAKLTRLELFIFLDSAYPIQKLYEIAKLRSQKNWSRDIKKYLQVSPEYYDYSESIKEIGKQYGTIESV